MDDKVTWLIWQEKQKCSLWSTFCDVFVMFLWEWLLHVVKQYSSLCRAWGETGCSDGLLMHFHSMCLQYLEEVLYHLALIKHYWKFSMDCEGARISYIKFNASFKPLNISKAEQCLFQWQNPSLAQNEGCDFLLPVLPEPQLQQNSVTCQVSSSSLQLNLVFS